MKKADGIFIFRYKIGFDSNRHIESTGITNKIIVYIKKIKS